MATQIRTWQIVDGELQLLESSMIDEGKKEQYDLESWIASNPSIIGPELVVIGRQVPTKSGPLDLLAIDRLGNVVVIELKRDILPRDALAQAIDYASDIADWNVDRIGEVCVKYTGKSLDDLLGESFPDIDLETLNINETQRIVLVGFSIESALERMIEWLLDKYGVSVNAVLLNYTKTRSGDELLVKTSIISEEVERERSRRRTFQLSMSDKPGEYDPTKLEAKLTEYLSGSLNSAQRIRRVLLPVCLEQGVVTRDKLKEEFVKRGEADSIRQAGSFLSLISTQMGIEKNDFLRQVIGYGYPNHPWEKDNYHIREGQRELIEAVLKQLEEEDDRLST